MDVRVTSLIAWGGRRQVCLGSVWGVVFVPQIAQITKVTSLLFIHVMR